MKDTVNELSAFSPGPLPEERLRSDAYPAYTARDFLTAVFYFRRALLLAFLSPAALGLIAAILSHTVYTAQARLLVLYGSDYIFRPAVGQAGSGLALDRNQIMQGELQILQSTTLAIETLRQVGVEHVYPGTLADRPGALDLAAASFARDLTVTAIPQSNVIELAFANPDREVAATTLRTLIERYLVRRAAVFEKGNQTSDGRDDFAQRLHNAEDSLARFNAAHGITDFDQQISLLLTQRSGLADQQNQLDQALQETAARLETIGRQIAALPTTIPIFSDSERSQQVQGTTDALVKLQLERQSLLARYQPDFPLVQDVDHRIAALRAQLAGTPATQNAASRNGRNPLYQDLDTQRATLEQQLDGLQARRTELVATAAALQARLEELNGLRRQYRDLVRTRDVLAETYRTFLLNAEEAALGDVLERSRAANVRVLQPPEPPPTGRNLRPALVVGGMMVGLLTAAATLALLNALRQVFITVHDAERSLDLPVLLAVPRAPRGRLRA